MATQRHLTSAPLREALIDIRVKAPSDLKLSTLEDLHRSVTTDYPLKEEWSMWKTTFQIHEGTPRVPQAAQPKPHGYWFRSSDGKQLFQARLDGFTFNRMHPYTCWKDIRQEARRLWTLYAEAVRPDLITRVALRYINQIELPHDLRNLSDFVSIPPPIPPTIEVPINTFSTRAVLTQDKTKASCNLLTMFQPSPTGSGWTFVLDIDVFKGTESTFDDAQAWTEIDNLRILKNEVFFGSITEKTASLCQ